MRSTRHGRTAQALSLIHISDIKAREPFRQLSYVEDVAVVHVVGEGVPGYAVAITRLIEVVTGHAEG